MHNYKKAKQNNWQFPLSLDEEENYFHILSSIHHIESGFNQLISHYAAFSNVLDIAYNGPPVMWAVIPKHYSQLSV